MMDNLEKIERKKEQLQNAKDIRETILTLVEVDIMPFVDIDEIELDIKSSTKEKDRARREEIAREKAFLLALNICMKVDTRLHGGLENDEIAIIFGVTRSRIASIESSVTTKLRHPKVGRVMKKYLGIGTNSMVEGY